MIILREQPDVRIALRVSGRYMNHARRPEQRRYSAGMEGRSNDALSFSIYKLASNSILILMLIKTCRSVSS